MGKTAVRPPKRDRKKTDHLAALADLLGQDFSDPVRLFEHSLALLRERLGADQALLTRVTSLGHEVFWWSAAEAAAMQRILDQPENGLCSWVMSHPNRPLVIRDAQQEPLWRDSPCVAELGIRAYAGVVLREGNRPVGTLCVQHGAPLPMGRGALALLKALGHLLSKTLEAEQLKQELLATRDALELSSAVVQDSALQSGRSGLPNRHYLDIWTRPTVFLARRRGEAMTLMLWAQPWERGLKTRLQAVMDGLRGEDLMVEFSPDHYLLLLPHTTPDGAEVLLARAREQAGIHPTGATLWDPDGEDLSLQAALHHVKQALAEAQAAGRPLVWHPALGA
ncbi:MAG TPA: GAF domain-containing protein [Holophagaceae bacterium]